MRRQSEENQAPIISLEISKTRTKRIKQLLNHYWKKADRQKKIKHRRKSSTFSAITGKKETERRESSTFWAVIGDEQAESEENDCSLQYFPAQLSFLRASFDQLLERQCNRCAHDKREPVHRGSEQYEIIKQNWATCIHSSRMAISQRSYFVNAQSYAGSIQECHKNDSLEKSLEYPQRT